MSCLRVVCVVREISTDFRGFLWTFHKRPVESNVWQTSPTADNGYYTLKKKKKKSRRFFTSWQRFGWNPCFYLKIVFFLFPRFLGVEKGSSGLFCCLKVRGKKKMNISRGKREVQVFTVPFNLLVDGDWPATLRLSNHPPPSRLSAVPKISAHSALFLSPPSSVPGRLFQTVFFF